MSKVFKKLSIVVLSLVVLTGVVAPASAATADELQAQIAALMAQINGLNAQLSTGTPATTGTSYTFTRNLTVGSRGADVTELQKFLVAQGHLVLATPTTYFGNATKAALAKFQKANGIAPAAGYFGAVTRAKVNAMMTPTTTPGGTNPNPTTTPSTGAVSVSLAGTNPATGYVVNGQAGARLAALQFSGTGSVTSLVLRRSGVSSNDVLTNVYLYDGNVRITDAASVTSDGKITFNNPSGLFAAPKVVEVRADVATNATTNGSSVGVSVESFTVAGSTATTVTGVAGNNHAISTTSLATVALTNNQGNSNLNVNAGTVNQNVWDVTASIGTRAVSLKALTFKYVGSAPTDAVANLSLYVDGVKVGSTATVNALGLVVFDFSNAPVALTTGTHTLQLRGDFVKGSNRTAQFYIQNAADYMIEDSQVAGAFIIPTVSSVAATNVYGRNFQIQAGSLVVSQDPTFTTTQLVGGATNATIGKFQFKAYGEDMKVETLLVTPISSATPTSTGAVLQNVTLYVNGAAIGSSQNWTSGNLTFNPGSNMIVPAGGTVTLEVKADLRNGAGASYTGGAVEADIVGSASGSVARGQSSQTTATFSGQTGKSLTVGSASTTFAKTGGFFGTTVNANTTGVKIGSFTLSNSNFEDIRVTNLLVSGTYGGGMTASNLSDLRVTGSDTVIAQPTGADNFSMDLIIPMNSTKTFDITANIGSATSSATTTTNATVSYRGVSSSVSTSTTATGVTMTVGSVTLVSSDVTTLSSSAPTQLVTSGTSMPTVTYNVKASTAPVTINEMTFSVAPDADAVTAIKVGGVTKTVTAATGNVVTGLNIVVPAGAAGLDIPVEVTFGNVNTNGGLSSQTGASSTITLTAIKYTSGSNVTTLSSLSLASNAMQLVASKPSVTVDSVQKTGLILGTENKIGEVTVVADAKGSIKLNRLVFNVGYSGFSTGPTLSAVRIADGSTTIAGSSATTTNSTTSPVITVNFGTSTTTDGDGYSIAAGTSKTFSVFATNTGGVVSSGATGAISAQVQGGANFIWDDVNGGGTALTATNLYNFPTASYSVRQ